MMSKNLIDRIRNKKDKNGVEELIVLCADESAKDGVGLTRPFVRAYNNLLKDLERIEKLDIDRAKIEESLHKTYSDLTINYGNFHKDMADMTIKRLVKDEANAKKEKTLSSPAQNTPPTPSNQPTNRTAPNTPTSNS